MKSIKLLLAVSLVLSMVFTNQVFPDTLKNWQQVLNAKGAVNIYVEDIVNDSGDSGVDAQQVTSAIKSVFMNRKSPAFSLAENKSQADIIFSGTVVDYVWEEKAPVTAVYNVAALAVDLATRNKKSYARMEIHYKIISVVTGKAMLNEMTKVILKERGLSKGSSYAKLYKRIPSIIGLALFKREKNTGRPGTGSNLS